MCSLVLDIIYSLHMACEMLYKSQNVYFHRNLKMEHFFKSSHIFIYEKLIQVSERQEQKLGVVELKYQY